jgi:hypothetical protein
MTTETNEKPGCLNAIVQLFRGKAQSEEPATDEPPPYRLRDNLLSPAEISFYHVLKLAVADQVVVLAKIRLTDLFKVAGHSERQAFLNKISKKHIDFLLCRPDTMRPIIGIELDDRSHQRADRQARDAFVDQVFAAAELPLVHIVAQRDYNTREIEAQLSPFLQARAGQPESPPATDAPLCPRCGVPMVKRTAKRGEYQGKSFYGCPNYPQCREMLPGHTPSRKLSD